MVDYLIVGYGIAGALLSVELSLRGLKYHIVNQYPSQEVSSRVAAGIWAPLTGLHVSRALFAGETLRRLNEIYPRIESAIKRQIYHPQRLYRVFKSALQRERWLAQRNTSVGREFLGPYLEPQDFPHEINAPRGGIEVRNAGWVDTLSLIDKLLFVNAQHKLLSEEVFDVAEMDVNDECIRWRDIQARNIVFCNGAQVLKHSPFSYVPFKATQGDILTIRTATANSLQGIYHGARFLLPLGEGLFRVGASYVHDLESAEPSESEGRKIEGDLQELLRVPYVKVEHRAGMRPNTLDNVAVVGSVPYDRRILILNGLGSKGVLQAPWLAQRLVDYSLHGRPLPQSVDVARFYKRWKKAWLQRA